MTASLPRQPSDKDDDPPGTELALLTDQVGRNFLAGFEGRPASATGAAGLVRFLTSNAAPDSLVLAAREEQRTAADLL